MMIPTWAVIVLFLLQIATPAATLPLLWLILGELQRLQQARLPDIQGFTEYELKQILAHAADLEFPGTGRKKAFSRRNMEQLLGRDAFETLRDGLEAHGMLESADERGRNQWTAWGRLLLMGVKSGRYGPVVTVIHDRKRIQIYADELTGYEIPASRICID